MSENQNPDNAQAEARWPRVLGTLGIVIAVLIFIDKLDDLVMIPMLHSRSWWGGMLGQELGDQIVGWMPSRAWLVASSVIGMGLGLLLFIASLRLRRGLNSGVSLSRTWAWLAIAWLIVETVRTSTWMASHAGEIDAMGSTAVWMQYATVGIVITFAVLLAYPVFLLVWFARPQVQAVVADWPDSSG